MNAWDYAEALRGRWRLVVGSLFVVMLAVIAWCFMSNRQYTAIATVLFDTSQADPTGTTGGGDPGAKTVTLLGTQADVIRSVFVAQRVVQNLSLDKNPAIIAQYQKADVPNIPIVEWLARRLTNPLALVITPTKTTNVLAVNYLSIDPNFSALLANGFVDAYVQTQLQLKIDPAKVYSQWFESRIREVRDRLEQAQARLTAFEQQKGLIGAGKMDVEAARLSELSAQLTSAESQSAAASAKAGSDVGQSQEAQMSGLVQGLDSSIAAKSGELQQMRQTFGPNYPAVIAAQAQLVELREKRSQAVGTAVDAVRVASAAANAQVADLRGRVAAQRDRVLKLSSVQDQMAVLQRDVDLAQANYQAVTSRLNAVRLQSAIPQTNVSVLDRASPPTQPSSPNIPVRLLLGLVVGLALGCGSALALEWFSPRVRTIGGLEGQTHIPVLVDLTPRGRLLRLAAPEA